MIFENDHYGFGQAIDHAVALVRDLAGGAVAPSAGRSGKRRLWSRIQTRIIHYLLSHAEWLRQSGMDGVTRYVQRVLWEKDVANRAFDKPLLLWIVPYDVTRPFNGGSARVHGLCRALSERFCVRILTITAPGLPARVISLGANVGVWSFPLPPASWRRIEENHKRYGEGSWLLTLLEEKEVSPADLGYCLEHFRERTRLVVLDSPYLFPSVEEHLHGVPLVYQTNDVPVEFVRMLVNSSDALAAVDAVRAVEERIVKRASLVVCVCQEDLKALRSQHELDIKKVEVIENGVDTGNAGCYPPGQTCRLRSQCGLDRQVVLFIGSPHEPNLDAVRIIAERVAPQAPRALFVIIGLTLADAVRRVDISSISPNMIFTGRIDDTVKEVVFMLSDVAIAPMVSGTGSSLKIPDYILHGKPVVTTETGMRSFCELNQYVRISAVDHFALSLNTLLKDLETNPTALDDICIRASEQVRRTSDWCPLARPMIRKLSSIVDNRTLS